MEKFHLILFVSESDTNRTNWDFPFIQTVSFVATRPCFLTNCFLTVGLERKTGITGVPFGRTEVSIYTIFLKFFSRSIAQARSRSPSLQGMPEKSFFHDFAVVMFQTKMVDQHGWILESRAENDTK